MLAAYRSRDAQREIIGLCTAADKQANRQVARHRFCQPFRVVDDCLVQVASMCVKRRNLFGNGCNYLRVCVTDRRNIVIAVKVTAAFVVKHPYAVTTNHVYGLLVEQAIGRPHEAGASLFQFAVRFRHHRRRTGRNAAGIPEGVCHFSPVQCQKLFRGLQDRGSFPGKVICRVTSRLDTKIIQQQGGYESHTDEVVQDLEFALFKRQNGVKCGDTGENAVDGISTLACEAGHGYGKILQQRRETHVAEVDQAANLIRVLARAQNVAVVPVVVNHLVPELFKRRQHFAADALKKRLD